MTPASAPPTFVVPDAALFEQLATGPLPLHVSASAPERRLYREAYFDTPEGTLLRHGVTCSLRLERDRPALLVVAVAEPGAPGDGVGQRVIETPVGGGGIYEALRGPSEAARRVQQLVEPGALRARIAVDVERRTRVIRSRWLFRPRCELRLEQVSVQSGGIVRVFREVTLRGTGSTPLELAVLLRQQYGLRAAPPAPRLQQALEALADVPTESPAARPLATRGHLALLAVSEGRIGLVTREDGFGLPLGEGSGRKACLRAVERALGSADGAVRMIGAVSEGEGGGPVELWLARDVHRPSPGRATAGPDDARTDGEGAPQEGLIWPRLDAVLERLGAPPLRDRVTLAALTLAARTGLLAPSGLSEPEPALEPPRPPVAAALDDPAHFLDEELSFLDFDLRVLELAEDPRTPLLERLRFLAIFSSNLDEFFMVRVGGLKRDAAEGKSGANPAGFTPAELLALLDLRVRALVARQRRCLEQECLPALAPHGIRLLGWDDLDEGRRAQLADFFDRQVFPVLTPHALTMSPGHPFPHIPNLSLSLAVVLREPGRERPRFAHLKLPDHLPRFVFVAGERAFVPLEQVIAAHVAALFPGLGVEEAYPFRVVRSGDVHLEEGHASSLLDVLEEEVEHRPFKDVVRIEVDRRMPTAVRELLLRELRDEDPDEPGELSAEDLHEVDGPLDLRALGEIADLPDPELHYPPFRAAAPGADRSIFAVLQERDLLVHHPYDSFEATVQRFFLEAAEDPAVLALKLTLYRAGKKSPIGDALLRAAERGKEVSVFVELKARFDEERNIEWARRLEDSGIHVVYGLVGLKTHSKIAIVVRREGETLQRYAHVGTGNYNAATARLYTDLGLLTADAALTDDVCDLFNELTGIARPPNREYRRLLVAPGSLLPGFIRLIEREGEHARAGRGGRIRAKLNGLADAEIIAALYGASRAGVAIDLSVRGICALRPGVPGLSERIRVRSILGRFLEHARIFAFDNGGSPEYFIGSADWRPRNLRRRVEVVAPVADPACRARLESILRLELEDPTAWELRPDGRYARGHAERGVQDRLLAALPAE